MVNMLITFKDKTNITIKDIKNLNVCLRTEVLETGEKVEYSTIMGTGFSKNPFYIFIKYSNRAVLINIDFIDSIHTSIDLPYSLDDVKKYFTRKYNFCDDYVLSLFEKCNISTDSEDWYLFEFEYKEHIKQIESYLHTWVWRN